MDELLDYVLKWFIPFACAGLFTLFIRPLLQTFKQGHQLEEQEKWDEMSKELKKDIAHTISEEVNSLHKEIANKTDGIRDAILVIHLERLISESKKYIAKGSITTSELEDYQEKYKTYVNLGGNGHMDPWYPKVMALPIISENE